MNTSGLFRDLDPPGGGAERLREALAAPARDRRGSLAGLATAASLCLLAIVAWIAWPPASPSTLDADVRAALASVLRPPADGFEPRSARVVEKPAAPAGVRFYVLAPRPLEGR
jgi:hypothetical protein